MQRDFGNRRLLVGKGVVGVFGPFVGGGDNQAVAEIFFTRCGEKAVDVGFLNGVFRRKVLALHGVKFAGVRDGDQIDACVCFIRQAQFFAVLLRPCGVGQHLRVLFFVQRLVLQVGNHQAFKRRAFVALGLGGGGVAGEEGLERGHFVSGLSGRLNFESFALYRYCLQYFTAYAALTPHFAKRHLGF